LSGTLHHTDRLNHPDYPVRSPIDFVSAVHRVHLRAFAPLRLCALVLLLTACSGVSAPVEPTRGGLPTAGGVPSAQQTAFARLTEVPATPAGAVSTATLVMVPAISTATALPTPTTMGANSATLAAGNSTQSGIATTGTTQTPRPVNATMPAPATVAKATQPVTPVSVTEVPPLGADGPKGGMAYTNPMRTFRFVVPADWSPPMPEMGQTSRVVSRSPGNAVTLTVEESTPPDDWQRLPSATVAGTLDGIYRAANPSSSLQSAVLTGVRGQGDLGLTTYRFTYNATVNNAPVIVERFVTLAFTGGITTTATGARDAYNAAKPTVETIVGSLVPLKQDAPTPAALAPVTGSATASGGAIKTSSGLGITLPMGWITAPTPMQPPGIEFLAQSADKTQTVRVIRKPLPEGMTLNDFASTGATEFKGITQGYDVDDEGENTVGGQRAVRVVYNAVVDNRPVEGQSVTFLRGGAGYIVMVEVPAPQYTDHQAESQSLFDRIESSVMLP